MFKLLKLISILCISLLTYAGNLSASKASTVSGYVYKDNFEDVIQFTVKKGFNNYVLDSLTPYQEKVLNRLKSSDYVSISGDYHLLQAEHGESYFSMKVFDINYVGLTDLLGYWKDEKGLCYHFSGYTKLVTYLPSYRWPCNNRSSRQVSNIKHNNYNYIILPSTKSWIIGLSSNKARYTMEAISISPSNSSFYLYNAETGDLISTVNLHR